MNKYDVFELPAPVSARTIPAMAGAPAYATMTTPPAPVLPDPEVARLQRVLEDVRFSLERGYWQAALAAARAV